MTILDWIIISAVWLLIHLCLFFKARQESKFRKYQKEEEEDIRQIFKGKIN
jgi:hypothetical protein